MSRGSLEKIINRRVALFAAFFALARMTGAFAADGASVRPLDPARDPSHLLADCFFALFLRLIGLTGPEPERRQKPQIDRNTRSQFWFSHGGGRRAAGEDPRVFSGVAARYDLMNDLMSFGLHRLWKRSLVAAVAARDGETIVDLAGGTGDVAAKFAGPDRCVTVCDPSVNMMAEGRKRQLPFIGWIAGEAEAMPFADASVDCLTISFGIRNVTRLRDALAEMHRVLKPGGRLLCLEFSKPQAWLAPFYNLFSFQVIPRLGAMVAQEPEAYAYLVEFRSAAFPISRNSPGCFRRPASLRCAIAISVSASSACISARRADQNYAAPVARPEIKKSAG